MAKPLFDGGKSWFLCLLHVKYLAFCNCIGQRCLRVCANSGGGEFHTPWSVNGTFPEDFLDIISKAGNGTFPEQIFQHSLDIISLVEGSEPFQGHSQILKQTLG